MSSTDQLPIIFTAHSKRFFYCKDAVCEFVFNQHAIPVNPFQVFGYFLNDRVDRNLVRQGNNNLIRISDQLWVFGISIANGVLFEVLLARRHDKVVRFFTIDSIVDKIYEVQPRDLEDTLTFEKERRGDDKRSKAEIIEEMLGYDPKNPPPEQLGFFALL